MHIASAEQVVRHQNESWGLNYVGTGSIFS
jgi:hypothetical protein